MVFAVPMKTDERRHDRLYLALVALALAILLGAGLTLAPGSSDGARGVGRARNVDVELVRRMMGDGRLSDHEAAFYRVVAP